VRGANKLLKITGHSYVRNGFVIRAKLALGRRDEVIGYFNEGSPSKMKNNSMKS
jgi:hypothetical protein